MDNHTQVVFSFLLAVGHCSRACKGFTGEVENAGVL